MEKIIYEYRAPLLYNDKVVLYQSASGCFECLSKIYVCESCSRLLTVHPQDTVEEIEIYYCPQSLENVPSSEAMRFSNLSPHFRVCPACSSTLSTHVLENKYYFCCNFCKWSSLDMGIFAESPEALITVAFEKERATKAQAKSSIDILLEAFNKNTLSKENKENPLINQHTAWKWEHCDKAYLDKTAELCANKQLVDVSQVHLNNTIENGPSGVELRTKRRLRCRFCNIRGRSLSSGLISSVPNILVEPEWNPLKGDSSNRTAGKWFKKKCLGFDLLPRISYDINDETHYTLCITNPRDTAMTITLNQDVKVVVDPIDEVELPRVVKRSDFKRTNDKDENFIMGRCMNKALLRIPQSDSLEVNVDCDEQKFLFKIKLC